MDGVLGNRTDAAFKENWNAFKHNLQLYSRRPNHELQTAVYRAYHQATLQTCAALLERKNVRIDGWFRLGVLPQRMADAFREMLNSAPVGVLTQAAKQWLEQVGREQFLTLKQLGRRSSVAVSSDELNLSPALQQIETLIQSEAEEDRLHAIRKILTERVLADMTATFGEPPEDFTELLRCRWFEFFCANFQFYARHHQEVANAFQNSLLAKVAIKQEEWQSELSSLGGETLRRIEAAQEWLATEQSKNFEQLESSVRLLLPLLSFAQDQNGFNQLLTCLIHAEGDRVIDAVDKTGKFVIWQITERLNERRTFAPSSEREPLIHSLPIDKEIEGREDECDELLHALRAPAGHVLAFAAPGGFGKTALLTKLVQKISVEGRRLVKRATLSSGEAIDPRVGALLYVDGREGVSLGPLFEYAGRLVGENQAFKELYADTNRTLRQRLSEMFRRLSSDPVKRVWFVFDNFEPLLNDNDSVIDGDLREFFSTVLAGGHNVYSLIVGRDIPVFSSRERITELKTVGSSLFGGLPVADSVAYLKKSGAATGLIGDEEEIDAVLASFSERVHRIPLALVWAAGYLYDTGYTLKQVLTRSDLFTDFDRGQALEASDYRDKGLKRLHSEQLQRQPKNRLPLLRLLAFFKRPVPKGALSHLLNEIEMNKALTRLERSKLVTHAESADGCARFVNDPLEVNLYALHPVICENEFFTTFAWKKTLYERAAHECWTRASDASSVNRFSYALELYTCAEALYKHLVDDLNRPKLLNYYAAMLVDKGTALDGLQRFGEAVREHNKAIVILERLVNIERQTHLGAVLAMAYLSKGNALDGLQQFSEAVCEHDKAIAILGRLVNIKQQTHLADDLAMVYQNKGVSLQNMQRFSEAVAEYDKAIAIRERLVNSEQQTHLAKDLANTYGNKGVALNSLQRFNEAVGEDDKAIVILERLVNFDRQTHLGNDLAKAYLNKGVALVSLQRFSEAVAEYDKAIAIRERLVNIEQQTHLANDLAIAYGNKGVALNSLQRLSEALVEHDQAIALLERLSNVEQQTHLANDLAMAYVNKALVFEKQEHCEAALECYEAAIRLRLFCVEKQGMFWIMPDLLQTLCNRLRTLINLQRWPAAAQDVISTLHAALTSEDIPKMPDELHKALAKEFTRMASLLRTISEAERNLLYSELGDAAKVVRSLIFDESDDDE